MKRLHILNGAIFSILLAVIILMAFSISTGAASNSATQKYDLNGDGVITIADVTQLLDVLAGNVPLNPYCDDLEFTPNSDGQSYSVTGIGTCTDSEIIIPPSYKGKPVTEIADNALEGYTGIVRVVIPDSVTIIGESAFEGCSGLASLEIGTSVTTIKENAFLNCTALTSVSLYPSLSNITYSFDNTNILSVVFYGTQEQLSSLLCPAMAYADWFDQNGNALIYWYAEYDKQTNPQAWLNWLVESGERFYRKEQNYGPYYFTHTDGQYATPFELWPSGSSDKQFQLLYKMDKLEENFYPDDYPYTFEIWYKEKYANVPYKCVSTKPWSAIDDWGSSRLYRLPVYNEGMNDLHTNGEMPNEYDIVIVVYDDSTGHIVSWCNDTILYSDSSELFVQQAREEGVINYVQPTNEPTIVTSNGITYKYLDNCCIVIKADSTLSAVTIPERFLGNPVVGIGPYAFSGCSITSITIPDSVTSIGHCAFDGCRSLTSVTIPDSATSIGSYAFYGCEGLTSVTIPDSVTFVGSHAFNSCTSLKSVILPDSVTFIGSYAFYDCMSLTSVTIPSNVTVIFDRAFLGCSKLIEVCNRSSLDIVAGNEGNGMVAYYAKRVYNEGNSCLYTTSDGYIFYENGNEVYLVAYVGMETQLTLPNKYNGKNYRINLGAFENCTSLTSVTILDSVTSIGSYAFYSCEGLTSVTIGDSVASISRYAFEDCTSLTSITIGSGVTAIGDCAFYGCDGLTIVYYRGTEVQWAEISIDWGNDSLTSATIVYNYTG